MRHPIMATGCILLCLSTSALAAAEDTAPLVYPTAILPFQERGANVRELGPKVTDLLFAKLVTKPELYLVDREDLHKQLAEQELNLSGAVNPAEATKVGQLTGAKILVTGSVMQVDSTMYLVAKVIGVETSRVLGASVKGKLKDDLDTTVNELANAVARTILEQSDKLVPKPVPEEDRIAALGKQLADGPRPTVRIKVSERHIGAITIDPAAETEITRYCLETGFKVVDLDEGSKHEADVLILGEGTSEFAVRNGNLVSVKARLEVKAIDRVTGHVIASERQTTVAIDLTEQIAGKTALQQAGAAIAERLLPKLVAANAGKNR